MNVRLFNNELNHSDGYNVSRVIIYSPEKLMYFVIVREVREKDAE